MAIDGDFFGRAAAVGENDELGQVGAVFGVCPDVVGARLVVAGFVGFGFARCGFDFFGLADGIGRGKACGQGVLIAVAA